MTIEKLFKVRQPEWFWKEPSNLKPRDVNIDLRLASNTRGIKGYLLNKANGWFEL